MNEREKSDRPVLPVKLPNNAASAAAEVVEGRGLREGNATSKTRPGPSAGQGAPSALDRVRRIAQQDTEARFTALLHHVDVDRLRAAYWALNPKAATGVDGVTWQDCGLELEANLRDLHARVHSSAYRARPSRRAYIPKPDGRQRSSSLLTNSGAPDSPLLLAEPKALPTPDQPLVAEASRGIASRRCCRNDRAAATDRDRQAVESPRCCSTRRESGNWPRATDRAERPSTGKQQSRVSVASRSLRQCPASCPALMRALLVRECRCLSRLSLTATCGPKGQPDGSSVGTLIRESSLVRTRPWL